jgi:hypothetical protein
MAPFRFALAGGDDEAFFSIDAHTGALSFLASPDFETPDDADRDNVCDLVASKFSHRPKFRLEKAFSLSEHGVRTGIWGCEDGPDRRPRGLRGEGSGEVNRGRAFWGKAVLL